MKTLNWNGEARYAYKMLWVTKHDDPASWKELTSPARITPKTVITTVRRFDRATGKNISARSIHSKPTRLIAYRLAGKDWVTL